MRSNQGESAHLPGPDHLQMNNPLDQNTVAIFLYDKMKKASNFQIAIVQPQGGAQLLLDILPIQAWYGLCKCCVKEASNVKPLIIEAFNTVDHGILKGKLSLYGHRGKNLDWFSSYLTNRKQYMAYYYKKRS